MSGKPHTFQIPRLDICCTVDSVVGTFGSNGQVYICENIPVRVWVQLRIIKMNQHKIYDYFNCVSRYCRVLNIDAVEYRSDHE